MQMQLSHTDVVHSVCQKHYCDINNTNTSWRIIIADKVTAHCEAASYGRPLSVSGRPCYILPMFFIYLFIFLYDRLILRPWLTEVRENFTRGGP